MYKKLLLVLLCAVSCAQGAAPQKRILPVTRDDQGALRVLLVKVNNLWKDPLSLQGGLQEQGSRINAGNFDFVPVNYVSSGNLKKDFVKGKVQEVLWFKADEIPQQKTAITNSVANLFPATWNTVRGQLTWYVKAGDFFNDIVGMSEDIFRTTYGWHETRQDSNNPGALNNLNFYNQNWFNEYPRRQALVMGQFVYQTVDQLRKQSSQWQKPGGGKFSVIFRDLNKPEDTDVRYLVSNPANQHAVFQVASTFWGPLEGGMYAAKTKLEEMFPAAAQGEIISMATAGATIYRKYFMRPNYYLLKDFDGGISYKWGGHGPQIDWQQFKQRTFSPNAVGSVGIFIHADIPVSLGWLAPQENAATKPNKDQLLQKIPIGQQLVTLVFCSAYNLRGVTEQQRSQGQKEFAKIVQKAVYEGTVKAAAQQGKKVVYLTLMGASAFANEMAWLAEAMETSEFINTVRDYGLDVRLIYRPEPGKQGSYRNVNEDKKFLERMAQVADQINGTNIAQRLSQANVLGTYLQKMYSSQVDQTLTSATNTLNDIFAGKSVTIPVQQPQQGSGTQQLSSELNALTQQLMNLEQQLQKVK
ncbi:MAG: hypothetical protein AB7R69_02675 [Candidatus Babeliales bacterium]